MSLDQVNRIRAMLLSRRGEQVSIAARRDRFEAQMAAPLRDGFTHTPITLPNGTPATWIDPADAPGSTALLWLHGGAFQIGSARSYGDFAARLALASGVRVLVPDYRLVPEHRFPAALDDAIAALDWLDTLGGPIAVGGDSAGGNLAVAAIQARLARGAPAPAALWLISPYLDLTHAGDSVAARASVDPFVDPAGMPATAQAYLGDADPADPRASPLFGAVDGFPPTLVQVGSDEVLFADSARFARRLDQAGIGCTFQEWVGMIHVWPLFGDAVDEAGWAVAQGGAFMRRHLV